MADIYTSRVLACMSRLFDLLDSAAFPPHSLLGTSPPVYFGGVEGDRVPKELIVIAGTNDEATIEYATLSNAAQDDMFVLTVAIRTAVAAFQNSDDLRIDRAAIARLTELVDVVQTSLRSSSTGMPIGGFGMLDGNDCRCLFWKARAPRVGFYEMESGTDAVAEIDIEFKARI